MEIKMILFDLDGTLLPMDEEVFAGFYFKRLVKKAAPYGYEAELLIKTIWTGIKVMAKNDGSKSNEDAFWTYFAEVFGEDAVKDKWVFEEFYKNEFQEAQQVCGKNQKAVQLVRGLKRKGYRVALATNPLFPEVATMSRIRWAGMEPEDFELVTTYENCCYSKPNPAYYLDIAERLGVNPAECLMIGNNVDEDMSAETVGMKVFLLTDCLINQKEKEISRYPHGGFDELKTFIEQK